MKCCEFHFKQSVERKVKTLNTKGEEFRNIALGLLIASTPEAYSHALRLLKTFLSNNAESIRDWIEWWDARKEFAFRAFTSFNAPQGNLPEVIHAEWKNRDKIGVSLLECCYFDLRDRILLWQTWIILKMEVMIAVSDHPVRQEGQGIPAEKSSMLLN